MEFIGAEVSHKIRSAIKAKLMELGAYVDEELPDYIMVMVANKRAKAQMDGDLQLFLGSNTSHFTSWLYQVLQKLQEVTVGNLEKKSSKIGSTVMKDAGSTKRKSSTNADSDAHRKEKRRKSSESKKSRKSDVELLKDGKKDIEGIKPSKLSDLEKYSRSHNTKDILSTTKSETSDSVVSSSADSKTNRKPSLKDKSEKLQDSNNLKKNAVKSSMSNGSNKCDDKHYLSRLRAEALRSCDERLGNRNASDSEESKSQGLCEDHSDAKRGGTKSVYSQPLQRTKIVLMNSDDEDDDEDFINIKADAEAEQLLKEELPREVLEAPLDAPEVTPSVAEGIVTSASKAAPASQVTELRSEGGTVRSVELMTIPLKENLVPKRPIATARDVHPVGLKPCGASPAVPVVGLRGGMPLAASTASAASVSPVPTTSVQVPASVLSGRVLRKRLADSGDDASRSKIAKVTKRTLSSTGILSRVVPVRARLNQRNRMLDGGKVLKQDLEDTLREHVAMTEGEEEEYDPSNPGVSSVASVVRVKPRPKLPASLQANKNLILKAVAEAQKSVTTTPIRPEPTARHPTVWKRTNAGFVRNVENNVGVTFPNRHLQSHEYDDVLEQDVKPDSTRFVSGGTGNDKIIIKVSSTNSEKAPSKDTSLIDQSLEEMSDEDHLASVLQFHEEDEVIEEDEIVEDDEMNRSVATEEANSVNSGRAVYPPVGLASRMPRERSAQHVQYNSPQFLVTLDGLDPDVFGSRATSLDEQAINKEDFDVENVDSSGSMEESPKKAKTPIVYKVDSTEDTSETSTLPKSLERCKYWPSCRLGSKCNFHHPVTPCKTFPKCPFGDKCLYIHPFCKFNSACTRRDCPFVHAAPRVLIASAPRPAIAPKSGFTPVCHFFPKCSNLSCRFLHPKACRYGKFCSKQDCNYIHQDIPSVDKLKWTSPFKS